MRKNHKLKKLVREGAVAFFWKKVECKDNMKNFITIPKIVNKKYEKFEKNIKKICLISWNAITCTQTETI